MTREEASNILDDYDVNFDGHTAEEIAEAFDVAFRALEQEPCEDAISRQAVDTLVDELARAISDEKCGTPRGRSTATIMQDILDLPPVNPQPKTGHWINGDCEGGNCSICGEYYAFYPESGDFNYCPNCGHRMVEPQESEET